MKPVGIALLLLCLSSVVVAGVVLAAPEVSPVWSVGALALFTAALLLSHCRSGSRPAKPPVRERVVFQKTVRVNGSAKQGLQETPGKSAGRPEILVRVVDARGLRLQTAPSDSNRQTLSTRKSRTI